MCPEELCSLPSGIDGLCSYIIPLNTSVDKEKVLQTDGTKWKRSSSISWRNYGELRYADCRGSHKCENNDCLFKLQYGVINRTQVRKVDGRSVCGACEEKLVHVKCPARRYVKKSKRNIKVFHCGTHTCPVIEKLSKPKESPRHS